MLIRYHSHARKRMRQRNVTSAEVERTLREYETDVPAKYDRRNRYKVIRNRRIRVTFDLIGAGEYFVWTVTADENVRQ